MQEEDSQQPESTPTLDEQLKAIGIDFAAVKQNYAHSTSRALLGFDTQDAVALIGLQLQLATFFESLSKTWKETPESTRSMLRLLLPELNLVELLDEMDKHPSGSDEDNPS